MHWVPMPEAQIPEVTRLADSIHKSYPEDEATFAEKWRLYPKGCFSLTANGLLSGYMIAFPWLTVQPPKINALLRALPPKPDTFYLHDIAVSPAARGQGAAKIGLGLLIKYAAAQGFGSLSLTAVSGSEGYWQKQGFRFVGEGETMETYGSEARYMALLLNGH